MQRALGREVGTGSLTATHASFGHLSLHPTVIGPARHSLPSARETSHLGYRPRVLPSLPGLSSLASHCLFPEGRQDGSLRLGLAHSQVPPASVVPSSNEQVVPGSQSMRRSLARDGAFWQVTAKGESLPPHFIPSPGQILPTPRWACLLLRVREVGRKPGEREDPRAGCGEHACFAKWRSLCPASLACPACFLSAFLSCLPDTAPGSFPEVAISREAEPRLQLGS